MQSNIAVADGKITGTLKYLSSGSLPDVWGAGNFIALKFSDFSEGLTYENVKVGLNPSVSSGLVTLDNDKNGVFKITDKTQQLMVVQEKNGSRHIQFFDLTGLTLEGAT